MATFDPSILSREDLELALKIVPGMKNIPGAGYVERLRSPDLVIAPDGTPYLYRWHVVPRNDQGNVYFHIQVADDPERPLHDHPWDNQSVILSGGYTEIYRTLNGKPRIRSPYKGVTIQRRATEAHRLELLPDSAYTMTLFTTGPKLREWGFWTDKGWRPHTEVTEDTPDGRSIWKGPK